MPKILLLLFLALSLTACVSDNAYVNVINVKHVGTIKYFDNYSEDYSNLFYELDSMKTLTRNDTAFGININTGKVTKVAFNKVIDFPSPKGYFHFLQDSLLLYTAALVDYSVNDNHNRMLRLYNLRTNSIRFFQFTGLPVIFKDPISGEMKNTLKSKSQLNFFLWTYKFEPKDSSMFVLLDKSLTSEDEQTYTGSDKFIITKVYLNKPTNEIYKIPFPIFHTFGDDNHKNISTPLNCFDDSNNIVLTYPIHLDLYQFNKVTKQTKIIPVKSALIPNELPIDVKSPINALNTECIQVLDNTGGNGYFRTLITSDRTITCDTFVKWQDYRTVLMWQKDDGTTAEAILDKSIWSVAYVHKDTLFCDMKRKLSDRALTLEKYLITSTTKVPKDVYMNRIKAAVLKEKGK